MILRMRIVHIEAGRHLYGGAAQVRYLVDGLAAAGADNVLVCPPQSELAAAPPAARLDPVPMHGDLDVPLAWRLARVLKRHAPDLVHVHSRRGADLFGGVAASLTGTPAVITRRVDTSEPRWLLRAKLKPFRAVVALSGAIEAQVAASGISASRTVKIPSAVDTERFAPDPNARERLLKTLGWSSDALAVGVVAQLIARKRHAWCLPELERLSRELPGVRIVFFGRGPLEAALRAAVASAGLAGVVTFAGFRGDLAMLLPGLDVLVHPAEREGLGVALLEAASAGVPAVACAVGGIPDVVVDGETGVLVAVDDAAGFGHAIERLLRAPERRRELGAAARARAVRKFGVERLAAAHSALYERVLASSAAASLQALSQ
jgi:glycosyltransferase involved in cell wall biosynthesis